MSLLNITNLFVAGQLAKASEVNGNFDDVVNWSTTLDVDNFATLSGELDFLVGTTKAISIVNNGTFASILVTNNSTARSLDIVNTAQLAAGNAAILITDAIAQVTATSAELKMVLSASATIPAIDIAHGANVTFRVKPTHLVIPSKTTVERDAIVAAETASVLFNSTAQELQVKTSTGWVQSVPTGCIQTFAGFTIPSGWLLCDGTAVSRATYDVLLGVLSKSFTGTTATSTTISAISGPGIANIAVGWFVSGAGIQAGTTVTAVGASTLTISLAATASATVTLTGSPYGIGDGSTTFNIPDMRRRAVMGSGGSATSTIGNTLGSLGGSETHTLSTAQIPNHTHIYSDIFYSESGGAPSYTHNLSVPTNMGSGATDYDNNGKAFYRETSTSFSQTNGGFSPATSTSLLGQSHNNVQSSIILNYIIKY